MERCPLAFLLERLCVWLQAVRGDLRQQQGLVVQGQLPIRRRGKVTGKGTLPVWCLAQQDVMTAPFTTENPTVTVIYWRTGLEQLGRGGGYLCVLPPRYLAVQTLLPCKKERDL